MAAANAVSQQHPFQSISLRSAAETTPPLRSVGSPICRQSTSSVFLPCRTAVSEGWGVLVTVLVTSANLHTKPRCITKYSLHQSLDSSNGADSAVKVASVYLQRYIYIYYNVCRYRTSVDIWLLFLRNLRLFCTKQLSILKTSPFARSVSTAVPSAQKAFCAVNVVLGVLEMLCLTRKGYHLS